METMRQPWSEDKLDGLDRKVDEGFTKVDKRFEKVSIGLKAESTTASKTIGT